MSQKTDKMRAVVLTTTPLDDSTQLVNLYTEWLGRVTVRVPLKKRSDKGRSAHVLYAPLSLLEVILGGQTGQEVRPLLLADTLSSSYLFSGMHPFCGAQCFFIADAFQRSVREERSDGMLWQLLIDTVKAFCQFPTGWENLHLIFMARLTACLGYGIDVSLYHAGMCFDLTLGEFVSPQAASSVSCFNAYSTEWFCLLFQTDYDHLNNFSPSPEGRTALLDMLLTFLALHNVDLRHLPSVQVLKTLIN